MEKKIKPHTMQTFQAVLCECNLFAMGSGCWKSWGRALLPPPPAARPILRIYRCEEQVQWYPNVVLSKKHCGMYPQRWGCAVTAGWVAAWLCLSPQGDKCCDFPCTGGEMEIQVFRNWGLGSQWLTAAWEIATVQTTSESDWKYGIICLSLPAPSYFVKNISIWKISTPIVVRARRKTLLPFQPGSNYCFWPKL